MQKIAVRVHVCVLISLFWSPAFLRDLSSIWLYLLQTEGSRYLR